MNDDGLEAIRHALGEAFGVYHGSGGPYIMHEGTQVARFELDGGWTCMSEDDRINEVVREALP
jgi:uncharacterized protein involved in tellurium resistance